LEALQAIAGCAVVFSDALTPALRRLLKPFCSDCRPVESGEGRSEELRRRAARILAVAGDGSSVAYAAFGQPMVFGPFARELRRQAQERGVPVRVVGGLSAFDEYLVAQQEVFGYGRRWYQALDDCSPKALERLGSLDSGLPTVAFLRGGGTSGFRRALGRVLRSSYPAEDECRIFEFAGEGAAMKSRALPLARLSRLRGSPHSRLVVVAPGSHHGRR